MDLHGQSSDDVTTISSTVDQTEVEHHCAAATCYSGLERNFVGSSSSFLEM
jgi:hypothetical protein